MAAGPSHDQERKQDMRRRLLAIASVAGLGIAGLSIVVGTPAAEACGGNYPVTVEGDTGQGITYCSDGTIEGVRDLTAPQGDGNSGCGGNYPVTVETETVQLPGHGISYCSDGTFEDLGVPAPGATNSSCGGNYPAAVQADTGQGVTYCSDGTVDGVRDLTAPAGEEPGDCGGNYPVTVEVDDIETGPGQSVSYCSDGTFDDLQDPPL